MHHPINQVQELSLMKRKPEISGTFVERPRSTADEKLRCRCPSVEEPQVQDQITLCSPSCIPLLLFQFGRVLIQRIISLIQSVTASCQFHQQPYNKRGSYIATVLESILKLAKVKFLVRRRSFFSLRSLPGFFFFFFKFLLVIQNHVSLFDRQVKSFKLICSTWFYCLNLGKSLQSCSNPNFVPFTDSSKLSDQDQEN